MSDNKKVLGFQHEPRRKSSKDKSEETLNVDSDDADDVEDIEDGENNVTELSNGLSHMHIKVKDWCECDQCVRMPTERENICCFELPVADYFQLGSAENELLCITEHEEFVSCTLKGILYAQLVGLHDRESSMLPDRDKVTNRSYRYAAYRLFTWWAHLGKKKVRRVIPACVVNSIREIFPEPDGNYVGFKEGKEVEEQVFAFENEVK